MYCYIGVFVSNCRKYFVRLNGDGKLFLTLADKRLLLGFALFDLTADKLPQKFSRFIMKKDLEEILKLITPDTTVEELVSYCDSVEDFDLITKTHMERDEDAPKDSKK